MTHDYEAVLKAFPAAQMGEAGLRSACAFLCANQQTIINALKLAHKVTQEPSERMKSAVYSVNYTEVPTEKLAAAETFKAMIAQAQREIS